MTTFLDHDLWISTQEVSNFSTLYPFHLTHRISFAGFSIATFSGLGVTAGAHRLWSHKSYKAKLPLRLFLALGQTMAGQNCLYVWARDHRLHHKFSDSDADPHNINRGVFFSHCGWLLYRKHPSIHIEAAKLDMSDLRRDFVVRNQEM